MILKSAHPGNPRAQLDAWVQARAECLTGEPGGCDLANAAIELKGEGHPAHGVIERHKAEQRQRLAALCSAAGAREPQLLADTLMLLLEGARVIRQSMGRDGCCSHFSKACNTAIASLC